jgi:hypothetical protein
MRQDDEARRERRLDALIRSEVAARERLHGLRGELSLVVAAIDRVTLPRSSRMRADAKLDLLNVLAFPMRRPRR